MIGVRYFEQWNANSSAEPPGSSPAVIWCLAICRTMRKHGQKAVVYNHSTEYHCQQSHGILTQPWLNLYWQVPWLCSAFPYIILSFLLTSWLSLKPSNLIFFSIHNIQHINRFTDFVMTFSIRGFLSSFCKHLNFFFIKSPAAPTRRPSWKHTTELAS